MFYKHVAGFVTTASLLALASAQDSVPVDITTAFDTDSTELQASFEGDASEGFASGITLDAGQTQTVAEFALGDSSGVNTQLRYAIAMVDTTCDDQRVLHYFKTGFRATNDKTKIGSEETPLVRYAGPGSFQEQGSRTYTFVLWRQPRDFQAGQAPTAGQVIDINQFGESLGVGVPRAATAFKVELGGQTNCGAGGQAPPPPPPASSAAPPPPASTPPPPPPAVSTPPAAPPAVVETPAVPAKPTDWPAQVPWPPAPSPPAAWPSTMPWPLPEASPWPTQVAWPAWPTAAPPAWPTTAVWPTVAPPPPAPPVAAPPVVTDVTGKPVPPVETGVASPQPPPPAAEPVPTVVAPVVPSQVANAPVETPSPPTFTGAAVARGVNTVGVIGAMFLGLFAL